MGRDFNYVVHKMLGYTRSRKRLGRILPQSLQRNGGPANKLVLHLWPLGQ